MVVVVVVVVVGLPLPLLAALRAAMAVLCGDSPSVTLATFPSSWGTLLTSRRVLRLILAAPDKCGESASQFFRRQHVSTEPFEIPLAISVLTALLALWWSL